MVTPEDMKANAEYIHMADQHVDVPGLLGRVRTYDTGGPNYRNYANIDLIVDIARRTGVQVSMPSCASTLCIWHCEFKLRRSRGVKYTRLDSYSAGGVGRLGPRQREPQATRCPHCKQHCLPWPARLGHAGSWRQDFIVHCGAKC